MLERIRSFGIIFDYYCHIQIFFSNFAHTFIIICAYNNNLPLAYKNPVIAHEFNHKLLGIML